MSIFKKAISIGLIAGLSACSMSTYRDKVPERKHYKNMVEKEFDLPSFNKIKMDISLELTITEGDTQKVFISSEEDHFNYLDVSVVGNELKIDHLNKHKNNHKGKRHTSIEVQLPNLEELSIDGFIDADIQNITPDNFEFNLDGVGAVEISGACINAELNVDGVGDIDADKFKCENVSASMSGIGSIELYASKTVRLDVSGIGDVEVRGGAKVLKKSISGIGSSHIHDDK